MCLNFSSLTPPNGHIFDEIATTSLHRHSDSGQFQMPPPMKLSKVKRVDSCPSCMVYKKRRVEQPSNTLRSESYRWTLSSFPQTAKT